LQVSTNTDYTFYCLYYIIVFVETEATSATDLASTESATEQTSPGITFVITMHAMIVFDGECCNAESASNLADIQFDFLNFDA